MGSQRFVVESTFVFDDNGVTESVTVHYPPEFVEFA